ncbi:MAG: CCA tRNA nucleotidyltransferase [Solirubrobacteraceae bacterium]
MLEALRALLAGEDAWIVGGAVRDRLLGRPTDDFDVALAGDPERAAKALRRAVGGVAFSLSATFGGWRVVAEGGSVDFLPLTGGTLTSDLAARDFTVNALAEPVGGGEVVDPHGGQADLEAQRLRVVGPDSLTSDPLRVLRAVRLAAELGFAFDDDELARAAAPGLAGVAAERVFAELKRIVCASSPVDAVRLMESVGASAVVLPELQALKGVSQSVYHDADVYDHTLAVLGEVAQLEEAKSDPRVSSLLDEPLADELTRWQALRFAALFHDIAKPVTSRERSDGRGASFVGHDTAGASVARDILRRLRASERLADHVAATTLHHLRVGFLVREQPLSRRSAFRYLRATAPWSVDVTVFTCADRLATRGRNAEPATAAHLARARGLLDYAFAPAPAEPLVRGDDLARELGLKPGPQLGELLAQLEEDRFAGDISTREQALARAREHLAGPPNSPRVRTVRTLDDFGG